MNMWRIPCVITPDGTINGYVIHQKLNQVRSPYVYKTSTSSYGIKGPKNKQRICYQPISYNYAGQDVYGHTDHSIFVADGHGRNGLNAASDAIGMHKLLDMDASIFDKMSFKQIEAHLRAKFVEKMLESNNEESGSTFACMKIFHTKRARICITVNIGDSEALLIYKDKLHICSVAHAWDNLELYNRYVQNVSSPKNVCYNRWNASRHRILDPNGEYRPVFMYDIDKERNVATINERNLEWASNLHVQFSKPSIMNGTQSIRLRSEAYENWGSSVMINGSAKGQNMATYGDCNERSRTNVPIDMIHIYIHEIENDETVVGIVQTDGVSNCRTLQDCMLHAFSKKNAKEYLENISKVKDDMSVSMIISEAIAE